MLTKAIAAQIFAAWCVATIILFSTRGWIYIGVPPIGEDRPPFSDTYAQLVTADACLAGAGRWYHRACFIPDRETETHSQTYEPWLSFHSLGLTSAHYEGVAWTMIVIFYVTLIVGVAPSTALTTGLLTLAVFVPSTQLAVERGNFDLLLASMLMWAPILIAREGRWPTILGILSIAASVSLKIYTGVSAIVLSVLVFLRHRGAGSVGFVATLMCIAVVGPTTIVELGKGAPEGHTVFSSGAQWLLRQGSLRLLLLGIAVGLGSFTCMTVELWKRGDRFMRLLEVETQLVFLASACTALPLFLLKDSYDYRFVLWLPMLRLPLRLLEKKDAPRRIKAWAMATVILCLLLWAVPGLLLWINRWQGHRPAVDATIRTLANARQVGIWGLAGVLSAVAWRVFRMTIKRYTAKHELLAASSRGTFI